jgi:hypothetical protein
MLVEPDTVSVAVLKKCRFKKKNFIEKIPVKNVKSILFLLTMHVVGQLCVPEYCGPILVLPKLHHNEFVSVVAVPVLQ